MSFKKLVLVTTLFSASFGAYAQDSSVEDTGWFVGGSIGQAKSELDGGWKTTDTSLGIYGGFNFTKWFGLEAAFLSAEKKKYDFDFSLGSLSLTPKFTLAINDAVSLYAKAGLSSVVLTVEYEDEDFGDESEDWSGIGTSYGIGAQFHIVNGVKLRISHDVISADLESDDYDYDDDLETDIAQTSVGVHYQF